MLLTLSSCRHCATAGGEPCSFTALLQLDPGLKLCIADWEQQFTSSPCDGTRLKLVPWDLGQQEANPAAPAVCPLHWPSKTIAVSVIRYLGTSVLQNGAWWEAVWSMRGNSVEPWIKTPKSGLLMMLKFKVTAIRACLFRCCHDLPKTSKLQQVLHGVEVVMCHS